MAWQGIEGHDDVVARFRTAIERNRLASTFLFVGPEGIGKRTFALKLAQALLCTERSDAALDPCGRCDSCVQCLAGTHPDVERIAKPKDKSELPIALFVGPPDKRMQEGLCHNLSLKPFLGNRKIAIIDDADYLNEESANALLKTLEEPPPRAVLILIATSLDRQLPTIRSRCQTVRFQPLAPAVLAELIVAQGIAADPAAAQELAERAEGSLTKARELADAELWKFRRVLLARLSGEELDSVRLAEAINRFVDEAGTEAIVRRARLRQVIHFAAEFFRQLLRQLSDGPPIGDDDLQRAVAAATRWWPGGVELAADRLDRCLDALGHVDRNANQAALIYAWIDDLVWRETPLVGKR
jgi:DNA polymerase-3 subunit delta'